jgi:ABC-2 type transport system ATP-binding protein
MDRVVEVRDLTVNFNGFTAVDRISFDVWRGEIFGFLGANGAGKTTTIRVLCGLLRPSGGRVRVAGASFADGERAIKTKVGYMSQRFTLYEDLTVGENLEFLASLRKLSDDFQRRRRQELFDFISFARGPDVLVRDLSGGVRQQVSLVAALLHDPEIVFLDEPTAGVTPASRARFWRLIRAVAAAGKTVFVTTHDLTEAEQCGRLALMRDGKILMIDSPESLKRSLFPETVLEFAPRQEMTFAQMNSLGAHPAFSFFEPYGMRFHAAIGDAAAWENARPQFERRFRIKTIRPSLEDVFIRAVEARR